MTFALLQPGDPKLFGETNINLFPSECAAWVQANIPDYSGCVELLSVTQSLKPDAGSITVTKRFGGESPRLYGFCLGSKPLGKGPQQITKLYLLEFAQNQAVVVTSFMLRDAVIQDIQFQKTADGQCTETLQLGFSEIVWDYVTQNPPTPKMGIARSGWSFTDNSAIANFTS